MNDLVIEKNHEAVCTSLQIAEKFEKRHANVMRAIENIMKNEPTQNCVRCFRRSSYIDSKGERRPMYYINRDGFTFLVMGFTGKKANEWKWNYIKAFNAMETILREKSTPVWIAQREHGKEIRQEETDVIKELVEYAKAQGSKHPEKLYMSYSKMANKAAGVEDRGLATISQLNNLTFIENIIAHQVRKGMEQRMYYKDIFQECKKQIELFKNVAYLNVG